MRNLYSKPRNKRQENSKPRPAFREIPVLVSEGDGEPYVAAINVIRPERQDQLWDLFCGGTVGSA